MKLKQIVDAMLKEEYIMDIYEGNEKQAEEQISLVVHNTGFSLEAAKEYFTTIHNR
jgi:hypothetical protein